MKPKSIITGILLLFVVASVAHLVIKETNQPMQSDRNNVNTVTNQLNDTVAVYYFYGNVRCKTCRNIEKQTTECITTVFTNELAASELVFSTINVDEPENEHFIKDYELTTRSVVLSKIANGKEINSKNLTKIWDLVGDKPAFMKYISEETHAFLKEDSK